MGTPMALEIQYKDDGGYRVLLDGKELKYVAEYEVKKSSTMKGMAELMLKMRVKYPNEPDKTEDRSDDLIKVMDEAVEKKYQKIRESIHRNTGVLSAVEMDEPADCRICQKENDGSGDL